MFLFREETKEEKREKRERRRRDDIIPLSKRSKGVTMARATRGKEREQWRKYIPFPTKSTNTLDMGSRRSRIWGRREGKKRTGKPSDGAFLSFTRIFGIHHTPSRSTSKEPTNRSEAV